MEEIEISVGNVGFGGKRKVRSTLMAKKLFLQIRFPSEERSHVIDSDMEPY